METRTEVRDWTAQASVLGMERRLVAGLDLGQKQDYTALAVLEKTRVVYDRRDAVTYDFLSKTRSCVRHVERLPLGTAWVPAVQRVKDVMDGLAQESYLHGVRPVLVVDATGVGGPVVELLKGARMACVVVPVTITGGEQVTAAGSGYRVPKRDLITGLQVAFETRELEIARGVREMEVLVTELMQMRVAVNAASGHERYGVWREGMHDDLVLAVALAWWQLGRRVPEVWGRRRLV